MTSFGRGSSGGRSVAAPRRRAAALKERWTGCVPGRPVPPVGGVSQSIIKVFERMAGVTIGGGDVWPDPSMELLSRDRTICGGLFAAQRVRKLNRARLTRWTPSVTER